MKKLLIISLSALFAIPVAGQEVVQETAQVQEQLQAQSQSQELRNLKLVVRNAKGKAMRDIELVAQIKGPGHTAQRLDRFGNRFFRVTDADTLILIVPDNIYEFPLEGLDSLYVVFRNRSKLAGYVPRGGRDDELVNVGYGTVSRRDNTSSVGVLDMKNANIYTDLRSYMEGRVAGVTFVRGQLIIRGINSINSSIEALIVVDGVVMSSFDRVNATLSPGDVASISVLKDAGSTSIYGVRGSNGVVLITTKKGGKK